MGRKRAISWRTRIAALVLLVALGAGGWLWWQAQHWVPPRSEFPAQGVLIGARDGAGSGSSRSPRSNNPCRASRMAYSAAASSMRRIS